MELLQILLVLALFFGIKCLCWKITDEWGLPAWLNYKPWCCFKCLSCWTLLATFTSIGLIFSLWIVLGLGIGLTFLDTIAVIINERNNVIKIEDYDKLDK